MKKAKKIVLIAIPVLLIASVVFSGERTNPEIERTVAWDSPETKALFDRACADCHSHETRWPWYSYVAPVSWQIIHDVEEAREHFNVSGKELGDADEAAEELEKGAMPLSKYVSLHSEADLSDSEKAALIAGLKKTFGEEEHDEDEEDHDEDGDEHDEEEEEH